MKAIFILSVALLIFSSFSIADDGCPKGEKCLTKRSAKSGGDGSHGGDPIAARKLQLKKYFPNLKEDVLAFADLSSQDIYDYLKGRDVRDLFYDLENRGLHADQQSTELKIGSHCADDAGAIHAASTVLGKRGAPICFDLDQLALQNVDTAELVGLAYHEYAHHLGFDDTPASIRLISEIADAYRHFSGLPVKSLQVPLKEPTYIVRTFRCDHADPRKNVTAEEDSWPSQTSFSEAKIQGRSEKGDLKIRVLEEDSENAGKDIMVGFNAQYGHTTRDYCGLSFYKGYLLFHNVIQRDNSPTDDVDLYGHIVSNSVTAIGENHFVVTFTALYNPDSDQKYFKVGNLDVTRLISRDSRTGEKHWDYRVKFERFGDWE